MVKLGIKGAGGGAFTLSLIEAGSTDLLIRKDAFMIMKPDRLHITKCTQMGYLLRLLWADIKSTTGIMHTNTLSPDNNIPLEGTNIDLLNINNSKSLSYLHIDRRERMNGV